MSTVDCTKIWLELLLLYYFENADNVNVVLLRHWFVALLQEVYLFQDHEISITLNQDDFAEMNAKMDTDLDRYQQSIQIAKLRNHDP